MKIPRAFCVFHAVLDDYFLGSIVPFRRAAVVVAGLGGGWDLLFLRFSAGRTNVNGAVDLEKCDRRKRRSKVQFFRALVQGNAGNIAKRWKSFRHRDKMSRAAREFYEKTKGVPRESKTGILKKMQKSHVNTRQNFPARQGEIFSEKARGNFPKQLRGAPFSDILKRRKICVINAGKSA